MAEDDIIAIFLREAIAKCCPALAAIFGITNGEGPVGCNPDFITDGGDYPGPQGILWVDTKSEAIMDADLRGTDILPLLPAVRRTEYPTMVLLPQNVWFG